MAHHAAAGAELSSKESSLHVKLCMKSREKILWEGEFTLRSDP